MSLLPVFHSPYIFWTLLTVSNILMYLITMLLSLLWSRYFNYSMLKVTRKDLITSIKVVSVNIVVAFPGYWLFKQGYIQFTSTNFIRDCILLVVGFDLAMYLLHFLSHTFKPFKALHTTHHTHHHFNMISLYVMNPWEAFLFGVLLTFSACLYSFNLYSFFAFIAFNWLYGVASHLNTSSQKQPFLFGNHIFHKMHHVQPNCNYGFYTVVWDKFFGTYFREK